MKRIMCLTLAFLTYVLPISAEMYKWVDEHGTITFKDTPPPKTKKKTKVKVYRDSDFVPAPPPAQQAQAPKSSASEQRTTAPTQAKPEKPKFNGTIEMYVTDWCPTCKHAVKYIESKKYPVVKYDIEKDKDASRRYRELGGRGVPLIIVGSNKMSGFSAAQLEAYLGNN